MKKLLATLFLVLALASNAMATVQAQKTHGQNSYGIVCTGNEDFSFPYGFVKFIYWKPSAANDVICIRDASDAGPALMIETAVTGDGKTQQVYGYCKPYLDYSACTIGTGANYEVTVFYEK